MAQNWKEIHLGEKKYTIKMYSPTKATKVLPRLLKLLGGPLVEILNENNGSEIDKVSKALMSLGENLNEDEFESLIKELMGAVIFEGQPVNTIYDVHFDDGIASVFILAGEVIKWNYKDFLSLVLAGKEKLAQVKA